MATSTKDTAKRLAENPPTNKNSSQANQKQEPSSSKTSGSKQTTAPPKAVAAAPAGSPANPGTHAVTTPADPFLTPDQQQTLDNDYQTYTKARNDLVTQENEATPTEQANEAQQNYNSQVAAANANAIAAARGVFASGINSSDLADINTTLQQNLSTLRTNLANTVSEINGKIGALDTGWNNEQGTYKGYAADNAAGVAPTTTQVPNTPTTPAPATGAGAPAGIVSQPLITSPHQQMPVVPGLTNAKGKSVNTSSGFAPEPSPNKNSTNKRVAGQVGMNTGPLTYTLPKM